MLSASVLQGQVSNSKGVPVAGPRSIAYTGNAGSAHIHSVTPIVLRVANNRVYPQFVEDEGNIVFYKNAQGLAASRPLLSEGGGISDSGVEVDSPSKSKAE